jgi:excisionase family DNA binding protein
MLLTIDEVAKALGLNPRTIRRYIEKGQLRAERIGGSWRVPEDAVRDMLSSPESKEAVSKKLAERTEDMLTLYLQGKHRLQAKGLVALFVLAFNPNTEPWVLAKSTKWMAELNRMGQSAQFDFTMTGSERGLYRLVLIAPPAVCLAMIGEWERTRTA